MKIHTTEAVRRFNAQVELADIALAKADPDVIAFGTIPDQMGPERLHLQLLALGHAGLAKTLKESAEPLGYFDPRLPDLDTPETPAPAAAGPAPDPGQLPHASPQSQTKSADQEQLIQAWDLVRSAQKQMDIGLNDVHEGLKCLARLEDDLKDMIKKGENWREFCKNSARPGDIANVILERDEMRTTLKQCRKALSVALCGTPSPEYFMEVKEAHGLSRVSVQTVEDGLAKNTTEIKTLATSALARINSIIPPSEV